MATSLELLMAVPMLPETAWSNLAGAGFKYYAKGQLVYLLIRQFRLLLEDLSICVELDAAVELDPGKCSLQRSETSQCQVSHALSIATRHLLAHACIQSSELTSLLDLLMTQGLYVAMGKSFKPCRPCINPAAQGNARSVVPLMVLSCRGRACW